MKIFSYLGGGNLTTRPINHIRIDPKIQNKRKKTTNPATMVSKGGPCVASLVLTPPDLSATESPFEGLEFDADTACQLFLIFNLKTFLSKLIKRKKLNLGYFTSS